MSEAPPAPGWWKASDGNWYPPQPHPHAPPAPTKTKTGCLVAVGVAFAVVVLIGVLAIVAVTFLGHKAEEKLGQIGDAVTAPQTVNPDDLHARPQDQVREVGQSARISGFTGTVREARFSSTFDGLPDGSYLVVSVRVENRDDRPQRYELAHWHLQSPNGSVSPPVFGDGLSAGSLAPGASIEGQVVFAVAPDSEGDHFVLYRPDLFDEGRGVWTVRR